MATHTPGPWQTHYGHDITGYPCYFIHGVGGAAKRDAATLQANADLIAVAPELLRVVKACAPLWDLGLSDAIKTFVLRHHEQVSFDELGEAVKAVIAKAERK
jgi:hypothetical protein